MKKLMISFLFTGLILFNVNSVFACDCGCQNDECKCKKRMPERLRLRMSKR